MNKKKVIALIAIVLVIAVVAIVLGINLSRNNGETNKETYKKLIQFLQELSALNILEVSDRHKRRKIFKSRETRKFNY